MADKAFKSTIVIGSKGEIGKALIEVFSPYYRVVQKDAEPLTGLCILEGPLVMQVAIPYSDQFVEIVNNYASEYKPNIIIIHSTVPAGTCRKLQEKVGKTPVFHSPIRGRHSMLTKAIRSYALCYSGKSKIAGKFFTSAALKTEYYGKDWETTELAKVFSLVHYAMLIDMAKDFETICKSWGVDYDVAVKKWTKSFNRGIKAIEKDQLSRPIITPPTGKIGGHCVLPALSHLSNSLKDENADIKKTIQKILSWNN